MAPETRVAAITHVIQLAIAPVFLITGVCTLLGLLANRLGRIVDRARFLEAKLDSLEPQPQPHLVDELKRLSRRARLVNLAISCGTVSALLTCITIATLFTGTFLPVNMSALISVQFIASMFSLFLALLAFLREVIIATRGLRISADHWPRGEPPGNAAAPLVQE